MARGGTRRLAKRSSFQPEQEDVTKWINFFLLQSWNIISFLRFVSQANLPHYSELNMSRMGCYANVVLNTRWTTSALCTKSLPATVVCVVLGHDFCFCLDGLFIPFCFSLLFYKTLYLRKYVPRLFAAKKQMYNRALELKIVRKISVRAVCFESGRWFARRNFLLNKA